LRKRTVAKTWGKDRHQDIRPDKKGGRGGSCLEKKKTRSGRGRVKNITNRDVTGNLSLEQEAKAKASP